jgi:hypothetical protein
MYDFGSACLHDPTHDIDRGIMAIEKGRGGNDPDFVYRLVGYGFLFKRFRLHIGRCRLCHNLKGVGVRFLGIGKFTPNQTVLQMVSVVF